MEESSKMEEGSNEKGEAKEVFKCFLRGIDKWLDSKKVDKLLRGWGVQYIKCKKVSGVDFATISFEVNPQNPSYPPERNVQSRRNRDSEETERFQRPEAHRGHS